jgi:hypothetical protein
MYYKGSLIWAFLNSIQYIYKFLYVSPCDIISGFSFKNWAPRCPVQYVEWVKQTIKLTYEFVNQNLQRTAMRQKKNHDRGVKPRTFEACAFVWRWYPPISGLKLGLGWTGPFLVKQKLIPARQIGVCKDRFEFSLFLTIHKA